jgi:site-specific DNA recombinase
MKAAVYCRVSTDEQREKQSIDTQLDFATRYAALHEITVVEVYKDDGVSGGIPCGIRPEGGRLLADAKAGKFDLLLVYRVDRLSRSLVDLLQTSQMLEDCGITLQSMTEPFDTSTPIGKFVLQLLGMLAELEKANIRDRSVTGSMRIAREGKWLGGLAPLGYKVEKDGSSNCGRLVVDPEGAALIHKIFTLYVEDRLNLCQVADLLNAEGIPLQATMRGGGTMGKIWHNSSIHRILTNRTYIGENFYNKRKAMRRNGQIVGREKTQPEERVVRPTPPIIDPEVFAQAARILKENKDTPANAKREYLLRGLMKCAICGSSYSGVSPSDRNVYYYKCINYMHGSKADRCPSAMVRGDLLEADVWADIVNFAKNPGKVLEKLRAQVQAQTAELVPVQVEQDVLRQTIEGKQAERQRVIALVRKALITDAEAETELTNIQREIKVLEERNAALSGRKERAAVLKDKLDDTTTMLQRLAEAVEDATPATKRALTQLLVDGIRVETVNIGGKRKAHINATYVFEVDPKCITSIPHGSPDTTVTPLSANPDDSLLVASRPYEVTRLVPTTPIAHSSASVNSPTT